MKKRRKSALSTILLVVLLLAGLALLLYPGFSNYWNSKHATRAIARYSEAVSRMENNDYEQMWTEAVEYNRQLNRRNNPFTLDDELKARYDELLNVGGSGVMGYVEIENLNVLLPLYHGTSDGVLQVAVGHVDWSSLPVGGESTHCVISGHRGMPGARLFTDLDALRERDTFTLNILDQVLTYEIDQIRIVLPNETDSLAVEEGRDYCTLVTCTPYGINTHRLLVRGHRIETRSVSNVHVVSEAIIVEPLVVAPIVALPLLLIMLIVLLAFPAGRKELKREKRERRARREAEKVKKKT